MTDGKNIRKWEPLDPATLCAMIKATQSEPTTVLEKKNIAESLTKRIRLCLGEHEIDLTEEQCKKIFDVTYGTDKIGIASKVFIGGHDQYIAGLYFDKIPQDVFNCIFNFLSESCVPEFFQPETDRNISYTFQTIPAWANWKLIPIASYRLVSRKWKSLVDSYLTLVIGSKFYEYARVRFTVKMFRHWARGFPGFVLDSFRAYTDEEIVALYTHKGKENQCTPVSIKYYQDIPKNAEKISQARVHVEVLYPDTSSLSANFLGNEGHHHFELSCHRKTQLFDCGYLETPIIDEICPHLEGKNIDAYEVFQSSDMRWSNFHSTEDSYAWYLLDVAETKKFVIKTIGMSESFCFSRLPSGSLAQFKEMLSDWQSIIKIGKIIREEATRENDSGKTEQGPTKYIIISGDESGTLGITELEKHMLEHSDAAVKRLQKTQ
jgi:hypothetical protein